MEVHVSTLGARGPIGTHAVYCYAGDKEGLSENWEELPAGAGEVRHGPPGAVTATATPTAGAAPDGASADVDAVGPPVGRPRDERSKI